MTPETLLALLPEEVRAAVRLGGGRKAGVTMLSHVGPEKRTSVDILVNGVIVAEDVLDTVFESDLGKLLQIVVDLDIEPFISFDGGPPKLLGPQRQT